MKTHDANGQSAILRLLRLAGFKPGERCSAELPATDGQSPPQAPASPGGGTSGPEPIPARLSPQNREYLLKLARRTLVSAATSNSVPEIDAAALEPILTEKRACFVTLTRAGELRGCVGHVTPQLPLYEAVICNAHRAAMCDPRFPPVEPGEVDGLKIEISVLTDPAPVRFGSPADLLSQLHPDRDGVLLRIGSCRATFLPKVWATFKDKTEFLNHLCEKAGCDRGAWSRAETEVFTYEAEVFGEEA